MFNSTLSLGPAPADETPVQVGHPDYHDRALKESRLFVRAIRQVCGDEPAWARLSVTRHPHDFGTYYDVTLKYDGDNPEAVEYAERLDRHAPATWAEAGLLAPYPAVPVDQGKTYHFARTENGVVATVTGPDGEYPLPVRLDLRNHSPTGFSWGFHGSGPAQLALALCADALGDELALQAYQDVKRHVIARQAGDSFDVSQAAVITAATKALDGRSR